MLYRKPILLTELDKNINDITALKQGFDFVDDHVIITDENANILYANKAMERDTGFSINEVIGRNPADLWGGKMPREFYENMWHKIKEEKKPFIGEVQNIRKDGAEYWQELHISPILDKDGNVRFFIGIESNITERKTRDQFREEFVSILSHQSLTPLTGIRWTLQWLLERGGITQKQRSMLEEIYNHSDGLVDLIKDLTFLSRFGADHPQNENFNLATEVENVIKNAKEQHPSISFSFTADDPVSLYANKVLVVRLFSNIIFNAAEYSDRDSQGSVIVSLKKKDNSYVFFCNDNGIGIPEQDQNKVFSRLFRASNAHLIKSVGNGLGLFIVKMITDSYGWRVWFKSEAGEGSTFYVEIPFGWKLKS